MSRALYPSSNERGWLRGASPTSDHRGRARGERVTALELALMTASLLAIAISIL